MLLGVGVAGDGTTGRAFYKPCPTGCLVVRPLCSHPLLCCCFLRCLKPTLATHRLHAGGCPSIIVGNAQPDLLDWLQSREGQEGLVSSRVVKATRHEAWGILEGLQRLGFA